MMLKPIFLVLFCFSVFGSDSKSFNIESIKDATDSSEFYAVFNGTLHVKKLSFTPNEAKKFATTNKRVLRVPVVELEKFDKLRKGDIVSVADFDTDKSYQYEIKDSVYVFVFNVDEDGLYKSALILSDERRVHEDLSLKVNKRLGFDGIAYTGKTRKILSTVTQEWIPLQEIPKTDSIFKNDIFNESKRLRKGKFDLYETYVDTTSDGKNNFFFKTSKGKFEGYPRDTDLVDDGKGLGYYKWLENTKIFTIYENYEGEGPNERVQESIILLTPEKLEAIDLL